MAHYETELSKGEKVKVYRNLHRKTYSVQAESLSLDTGKTRFIVVAHLDNLYLTGVEFKVSEAGRLRVVRERKKNVHAKLVGSYKGQSLVAIEDLCLSFKEVKRISYNPYTCRNFTDQDGRAVTGAAHVWVTPRGVYALGVTYAASR